MRNSLLPRFVSMITLFVIVFPAALAALMVPLGLVDLARNSDLIITGMAVEQKSEWRQDRNGIITYVTVSVRKVLRGEINGDHVVVKIPGGHVDGILQRVSDAPSFQKGEEVVLFLRRVTEQPRLIEQFSVGGYFSIVGQAQGKYTVGRDGMARRSGFSVTDQSKAVDDNIAMEQLIRFLKSTDGP